MAGIKTIIGLSFVCLRLAHMCAFGLCHTSILMITVIGPCDRLPSRHPIRRVVLELPYTAGSRNLRSCAITELALRTSSEPR